MQAAQSLCRSCRALPTCSMASLPKPSGHWRVVGSAAAVGKAVPDVSVEAPACPPLPEKSVFRRVLPPKLVAFSSSEGRRRFAESMASGHVEPYFPLSEQFVTQDEPTFCGLGTLTMVMNALCIDPKRGWRDESGPGWRWWSDEMFPTACSKSLDDFRRDGITLDEFAALGAAAGATVTMTRPSDEGVTLEAFRSLVVRAATLRDEREGSPYQFAVTSFCRAAMGQTGANPPPPPTPPHPTPRAESLARAGPSPGALALTPPPLPPPCVRRRPLLPDRRLPPADGHGARARRRPLQVPAVLGEPRRPLRRLARSRRRDRQVEGVAHARRSPRCPRRTRPDRLSRRYRASPKHPEHPPDPEHSILSILWPGARHRLRAALRNPACTRRCDIAYRPRVLSRRTTQHLTAFGSV